MWVKCFGFIFFLLAGLSCVTASAATIRVPTDQATIQGAIDAAVNLDVILIADGTYTGAGNTNLDFGGKEITVKSENGPRNCIIDCAGDDWGVYFHTEETSEAELRGVTIKNASQAGISLYLGASPKISNCILIENDGDGIYAYDSTAQIDNCQLTENTGNGVYALSAPVSITNSEISSNTLAGVVCDSSALTITGTTISGNAAGGLISDASSPEVSDSRVAGNTGSGGIVCLNGGSPVFERLVVETNTGASPSYGGGGSCIQSSPQFTQCVISGNTGGDGGGVYLKHASPTFTGCTISANTSTLGGGVFCDYSSPMLTYSRIESNSGTGIYSRNFAQPELRSCIISKNTPATGVQGGGFHATSSSTATVNNCTIADNTGYGIYGYYASLVVTNSIVWKNTGSIVAANGSGLVKYSLVQGGYQGTGNLSLDPLFIDSANGDYRVGTSSPCLNAGTSPSYPFPMDIAGVARPLGSLYDIGAYEGGTTPFTAQNPAAPVLTVESSDLDITLSWTAENQADGYTLYYAPYPSATEIGELDMGATTELSVTLSASQAFYVAIRAYNSAGQSDYSNIGVAGSQ